MFQLEKDDLETFEKNNRTIAVNVFYGKKEKYILPMFQKNNLNREK